MWCYLVWVATHEDHSRNGLIRLSSTIRGGCVTNSFRRSCQVGTHCSSRFWLVVMSLSRAEIPTSESGRSKNVKRHPTKKNTATGIKTTVPELLANARTALELAIKLAPLIPVPFVSSMFQSAQIIVNAASVSHISHNHLFPSIPTTDPWHPTASA
jgi:hypothetical protein